MNSIQLGKFLVANRSSLSNRSRFQAMLHDVFPSETKETRLVMLAYDLRITEEIAQSEINDSLVNKMAYQLEDEYFIKPEKAKEVVLLWCYAFGVHTLKKTCSISNETQKMSSSSLMSPPSLKMQDKSSSSPIRQGEIIYIGEYGPDNNRGPIGWLVVEVTDGKALLVSKDALIAMPYSLSVELRGWNNCQIRKWLNTDFLEDSFSLREKSFITLLHSATVKNQGAIDDLIFVLSKEEYQTYISDDCLGEKSYLLTKCLPTPYLIKPWRKVYANVSYCQWWLREPCPDPATASVVSYFGDVRVERIYSQNVGVRPAMYVNAYLLEGEQWNHSRLVIS